MNEQLDSSLVKNFYQQEIKYRQEQQKDLVPPDEEFYQALDKMKASGQIFSGMGLGLDRLAMLLADTNNINQVEFFSIS